MAQFHKKSKKISLKVEMETEDPGVYKEKTLEFECSPQSQSLIRGIKEAIALVEKQVTGESIVDEANRVIDALELCFEKLAPGKWEEYLEFLGDDVENMTELLRLMVEKLSDEVVAEKKASIVPEIPEDAPTI